ncbi:MAG: hypothetical protein ABUK19_01180, partial [Desulfobacteria bacterium]
SEHFFENYDRKRGWGNKHLSLEWVVTQTAARLGLENNDKPPTSLFPTDLRNSVSIIHLNNDII